MRSPNTADRPAIQEPDTARRRRVLENVRRAKALARSAAADRGQLIDAIQKNINRATDPDLIARLESAVERLRAMP